MRTVTKLFKRMIAEESGANMVEYILVLGLIALVCVAGFTALGNSVNTKVEATAGRVDALP